ncbi:receptor-like protein kinase FERONIA isoform X4 [Fagus crenata]
MQSSYKLYVLLFSVSIFFNFLTIRITGKSYSTYSPIVLNCGSSGNSTDPDGRDWTGDVDVASKLVTLQQSNNTFIVSNSQASSVDHVPYNTARIFDSQFTYTFHVSPGQKFIRLYFYPSTYYSSTYQENFDMSKAFFTVTSGPFTLLRNFSASLTADSTGTKFLVKEFCVNVPQDQKQVNITFTPSKNTSYAFINGIEIVSMPTSLYYSQSQIQNNTALEMVHRLNVGGSSISPIKDSGMMFRKWVDDTNYSLPSNVNHIRANGAIQIKYTSIPAYTAPEQVYQTARTTTSNKRYNLTWRLPVDTGFIYLVRLHFCEIRSEVKEKGESGFQISIGNQTVETSADVITWSGGQGIPVYRDYVVNITNEKSKGKSKTTSLFIELRPNANSSAGHSPAILNGLELFKLNKPEVNPPTTQKPSAPKPEKYSKATKSVLFLASTIGVLTFFFLLGITIFCQRMRAKPIKTKIPPILIEGLCRRFSLQELRTATNNFDRNLIIGKGGSCTVYKGYIDDKHTPVAIKIIGKTSSQGFHEFKTEIEMLSKLRHPHLVSLIGYCSDERVMIIVYDFMPHGALRDHLYNTDNPPLCWKQRLEICIGAARGLLYLHEVLCAREAVDMGLDDEQQSLAPWARQCFEDSTLDQIIDPNLIGQIAPECLEIYTNIAYRCLSEDRNQRPTMVEVLGALEYAMELQEIADAGAHAIIINEEVPLSVGGNLVVSRPPINGDLVHSCPTIWKKSTSHKELLRFLSEKVGLKWVKSPKLGCCFATPKYNPLPPIHVQLPNLNSCGPYTTPGNF